jgi:hypothetical protein
MQYHPLYLAIRECLAAYVEGKISLHEFENWFFRKTWDVDKEGDPALIDLVYQIKLNWAEFSNGDWTEVELRDMLRPLVQSSVVVTSSNPVASGTSSTFTRFTSSVTSSYLSVDRQSLAVCV